MNITTLYAELVVVGTGATMFVALMFYSVFGDSSWFSGLGKLTSISVAWVIPTLSVVYLLGIVISNLSFLLFEEREKSLRDAKFSTVNYETVRNALYTSTHKELIDEFEFRRSKIRICRGWFVNSIAICIAFGTFLADDKLAHSVVGFWMLTMFLITIGRYISWGAATKTELDWLSSYAAKHASSAPPE